jgi:hypothetical protein
MSTIVWTGQQRIEAERAEVARLAIGQPQQIAARVAGLMYLLTIVAARFGFYVRGTLSTAVGAEAARSIAASGRLFRIGIVGDMFTLAATMVLVVALYVALEPVSRSMALLAAWLRLVECSIFAVLTLTHLAALLLLHGADYLLAFDTMPLRALVYRVLRLPGAGYHLGVLFLGMGSTVFAYLWFKSRYVPRALAVLGLLSSLLVTMVELAIMVRPVSSAAVTPAAWAPALIFEGALGLWLLVNGLRAPAVDSVSAKERLR